MITDVPDEKWDTPKDPATTKIKENAIRNFVKSGLRSSLLVVLYIICNLKILLIPLIPKILQ